MLAARARVPDPAGAPRQAKSLRHGLWPMGTGRSACATCYMTACLVCGHAGSRALFAATDRLYETTAREFQIVACEGCGLMRLDPQPAPEDLRLYYPAHYWYTPDDSLAGGLEENFRRLVLRDHVRFVSRA